MTITNPRTGQTMTFVTTTEDCLEIETINPPTDVPEPEHVHPKQESGCTVTSGELRFRVNGVEQTVGAGKSITIPANTPHYFSNETTAPAHATQWFKPALNTQAFFELLFALARADKLDDKGMPKLLQIAVMVPAYGDIIRPTSPPWSIQRAVATVLGPVARLRGYKP